MLRKNASDAVLGPTSRRVDVMSPRFVIALVVIACLSAAARPVRKTLNFNMFVLKPRQGEPERSVLATEGVSRFGPILEYLVQRVQGLMSVRLPPDSGYYSGVPVDAENEVDVQESRMPGVPGVVVRPSRTKPGTYEVEIDVVVDDGKPDTQ